MRNFAYMKAMFFTLMPMFVCLFWSTMLLLDMVIDIHQQRIISRQYEANRPRLILLIFMLTATLLYFGHCVFFNHIVAFLPFTDTIYCTANLAVYPLYYLYICSLTVRNDHYKERWVMLAPAFLGGLAVGTAYWLMSEEETQLFISSYLYEGEHEGLQGLAAIQAYAHDMCKVLFAIMIIPVFIHGRAHIKEYNDLVNNIYADTEKKTLTSLHYMLVAFIVTSAASFVANLIGRHQFDESMWLLATPSILFSVLLFTIGFLGYRQMFCISDIERDEQQADTNEEDQQAIRELRKQIEQLMEEQQLYRRPNLKIVDIVQLLNSNRNYIYHAINREMGISFSEYVNRMRIEHASLLIAQHPDMPLGEIAEQSGFSSTTSFYRNFKLYKNLGPREYQNNLKGVRS
jgi:AraC-like DNA-binding protein